MATFTRTCQQPGCSHKVSDAHLMCVYHWQQLSPEARRECQYRLRGFNSWDAAALWLEGYLKQMAGGTGGPA